MMGVIFGVLAQIAATPPTPPTDWSGIPELALTAPRGADDTAVPATFVRGEVAGGRCKAEQTPEGGWRVVAPVVLLITPERAVRQIIPRAIGCATVEQYTVGYVSSRVRTTAPVVTPGWYRVTVTYRWP